MPCHSCLRQLRWPLGLSKGSIVVITLYGRALKIYNSGAVFFHLRPQPRPRLLSSLDTVPPDTPYVPLVSPDALIYLILDLMNVH
jgi:hypothetical protein